MSTDPRRLVLPESLDQDQNAYELVSGWATGSGKITLMTRTGTGLDRQPTVWGEILAAIAGNIALSIQDTTGADPALTMAAIKEALDRKWATGASSIGRHFPNPEAPAS